MHVLDSVDERAIDELTARDEFFWLDLLDPADAQLAALGERFGWHPLALEDMQHFRQRPKLDRYGDQMLIAFYGAHASETLSADAPQLVEVHMMVSGSWVVTVRRRACAELDELRRRVASDQSTDEELVVYRIFDALTDTFFPVLERIDDEIDELEDAIVLRPTDEQLQRVFQLKRRLVVLRRVITPQRDLAARTIGEIAELPGLETGTRDYFRDVYDHLIRISDLIDSYRDLLTGAMDVYLSTVSNRLNQVMKQLTLVATVFLPITALTGFFGQNFGFLVRHITGPVSFFVYGVGGALLSIALLYAWFRRQRFFD
ncbi:MAG: magnesium/cobalt transporter CorA [Actinobacteria bacterium]|nr:magnesium/cobalt transporter CorA [Actinomycetota bacterium]